MVKCQLFPKWSFRNLCTRFMLTRGWGPFVEMKFNILVDSVESGRLSVDVSLRLATSTSTTASFSDLFRNFRAKPLTSLQCRYMVSSVKSLYQISLWQISSGFCAFALSCFVTSSAFSHSVIYSADSLFLYSCSRVSGPLLQSISLLNATFCSWSLMANRNQAITVTE